MAPYFENKLLVFTDFAMGLNNKPERKKNGITKMEV